jgi:Protein of unknown function (DUF3987)
MVDSNCITKSTNGATESQCSDQLVSDFMNLFAGSDQGHGQWTFKPKKDKSNKRGTDDLTLAGPLTAALMTKHLCGELGAGIIPNTSQDRCKVGVLEIDIYDETAFQVYFTKAQGLPFVPVKSKSGGLQLWLFLANWTPVTEVRAFLQQTAALLGVETNKGAKGKNADIFPAQDKVGEFGNYIRVPYFGGTDILAYRADGTPMPLEEFVASTTPVESFELVTLEDRQVRQGLPTDDVTAIFEAASVPASKREAVTSGKRRTKIMWGGYLWNAGYDGDEFTSAMLTLNAYIGGEEKATLDVCKWFVKKGFERIEVLEFPLPEQRRFPVLDDRALYGLAGEYVRLVRKHTESDSTAVLAQILIGYGNLVSERPYKWTEATKQRTNEFLLIVGDTAVGRKGTSEGVANIPTSGIDADWQERKESAHGFGSGEGIIAKLADATDKLPGTMDKRLLINEGEFASLLAVASKPGSILSPLLRNAWDCKTLANNTKEGTLKKQNLKVTDPRISIVAHVTREELQRLLKPGEIDNGFANRFLFVCSRRTQALRQSTIHTLDFAPIKSKIAGVFHAAVDVGEMQWSEPALDAWGEVYDAIGNEPHRGFIGKLCARAEAHIIRLAMIYALFDGSAIIRHQHLMAAVAFWQYCEDSLYYIYGDVGMNQYADLVLSGVRVKGQMTRKETYDYFKAFMPQMHIKTTVDSLIENGQLRPVQERGKTKPTTWLHATQQGIRRNLLRFFESAVEDEKVQLPTKQYTINF